MTAPRRSKQTEDPRLDAVPMLAQRQPNFNLTLGQCLVCIRTPMVV